ncbi:MAG: DUF952 domain-containing protein [Caulobacterales bacterium]
MSHLYKLLSRSEWAAAERAGRYAGSALDLKDGFIHLSTAAQAQETARRHFAGQGDLVLVQLDAERLGAALRWEPSRGGDLFPHLYAALNCALAEAVRPIELDSDGTPTLGELLA